MPKLIAQLSAAGIATALLLAAACGDDNGGNGATVAPTPSSQIVDLTARDFSFAPDELKGALGESFEVKLVNSGDAPHTFTVDALNVDEILNPGDETTFILTPTDPGDLAFYCRFHVAGGMRGVFVISGGDDESEPSTAPDEGGGYGN